MDLGSTYGTYVNPTNDNSGKIVPNVWVDLKKGSLVQFGAQNNWYDCLCKKNTSNIGLFSTIIFF